MAKEEKNAKDVIEKAIPEEQVEVAAEVAAEEEQVEAPACAVCGGAAKIKCPVCTGREKGDIPPLEGDAVCDLCAGEADIPCPMCMEAIRKAAQRPTIVIEFADPLSAQFNIRINGFHPALAPGQITMAAEFLKTRATWETMRTFDVEELKKAKKGQVQDLLRGVPVGGLPLVRG